MKFVSFLFFSALLTACGSPLDEGYWKEHNVVADPGGGTETGTEITYKMTLANLGNFDFVYSAESLKKLANGRIAVSVEVDYPANVTLSRFGIVSTPCSSLSAIVYTPVAKDQTQTFYSQKELSAMGGNPNASLESQYIVLYASVGAGTVANPVACSPITK